jgi:hypothetical protein
MKGDENVSPILTKTDRNSGMYFVCHFYFHVYSWLVSVEMSLICNLMQCCVKKLLMQCACVCACVCGHIQLHILWLCVSESGILLLFILQFSGYFKHLENCHNFHALFAQSAQNECIVRGHIFLSACSISETSKRVSFAVGVDVYTESCSILVCIPTVSSVLDLKLTLTFGFL